MLLADAVPAPIRSVARPATTVISARLPIPAERTISPPERSRVPARRDREVSVRGLVRREVGVPAAERAERLPEGALGALVVERLVDVRHVQGVARGRE